jgi:hypothetical protein
VGLQYEDLEYRPWRFQDDISVRNLSDVQLTNVVFKVTNRNSGRSVEERIGVLSPKGRHNVVTIDRQPLTQIIQSLRRNPAGQVFAGLFADLRRKNVTALRPSLSGRRAGVVSLICGCPLAKRLLGRTRYQERS